MFKFPGITSFLTSRFSLEECSSMKMTATGRVTIPLAMRKKHGFLGAAEIELIDRPEGVLVIKAVRGARGKRVIETLLKGGPVDGSTEELLRLTRGR